MKSSKTKPGSRRPGIARMLAALLAIIVMVGPAVLVVSDAWAKGGDAGSGSGAPGASGNGGNSGGGNGGEHQVAQEHVVRVLTRAAAGLDDHRRVGFLRRFHDGLDLFHVVDIERGQTVIVLGGVVTQFAQGNHRHASIHLSLG